MLVNFFKKFASVRHLSSLRNNQMSLGIIGVPFSKGQGKNGVEETPEILRRANLLAILKDRIHVKDYGNLQYKPWVNNFVLDNMNNSSDFLGCSIALIQKVQDILKENDAYLAIGGDHAIGFGSVAGHLIANPNTSVIWIDAHPDINLNVTSASGNIHGMPVSFLIKKLRSFWQDFNLQDIAPNCLPTKELVYIGLRDIDPYEKYILEKLGITMFSMDVIDKFGISKIIEMALESLNPQNKLHVSFDIDALDVSIAPSTGTAVHGGLTLRECLYVMETIYATNRVQGIDFVEMNPRIGSQTEIDLTVVIAIEVIKSICGFKRSGNMNSKKGNLKIEI